MQLQIVKSIPKTDLPSAQVQVHSKKAHRVW